MHRQRPSNSTASREENRHVVHLEHQTVKNIPRIKTFNRTATTKGGAGLSLFSKPKALKKQPDKKGASKEEVPYQNGLLIKTPSFITQKEKKKKKAKSTIFQKLINLLFDCK